jgi:hypothetical protein
MNEFGAMELVADDDPSENQLECEETLNISGDKEGKQDSAPPEDVGTEENSSSASSKAKNSPDDLRCCPTCGIHGTASELFVEGRFCSKECQEVYLKKYFIPILRRNTL